MFDTILSNATRLGEASFGILSLYEGDGRFRVVAMHNPPPKFAELRRREPVIRPGPMARLVAKQLLHIADITELAATKQDDPDLAAFVKTTGVRTILGVPMLKADELIGAIVVYRKEVRPFGDRQIELIKSFAAQAAIAIENTRLLNELRQRTSDLTESLEQQTATSDVLRVISSSLGELEPVFHAMLENATRICDAKFGLLLRYGREGFRFAAEVGTPPAFAAFLKERGAFQPLPGSHLDRVLRTKQVSHTADYAAEGVQSPPVVLGGARSTVDVPLLKNDELIGAFSIYRQEVRPFTDKQIALVQNFAAQAVIAIENARLLTELRQRTSDLTESLEERTATSEVLRVISSSPGDLKPVFASMLQNAARICDAKFGNIYQWDGNALHLVATHNTPPAFVETSQPCTRRPRE